MSKTEITVLVFVILVALVLLYACYRSVAIKREEAAIRRRREAARFQTRIEESRPGTGAVRIPTMKSKPSAPSSNRPLRDRDIRTTEAPYQPPYIPDTTTYTAPDTHHHSNHDTGSSYDPGSSSGYSSGSDSGGYSGGSDSGGGFSGGSDSGSF